MFRDGYPRRMLGPVRDVMGGNISGSGGTSGTLEIKNNVAGYILKATGTPNSIEGIPNLRYNSTDNALTSSADMYVSGASNYLYIHGTDDTGAAKKFRIEISGSLFKIVDS